MGVQTKLDSGKLEIALYNFVSPLLSGICDFVKPGGRNASKNPDQSVYCNSPVQINDLDAIGKTIARIEIYVAENGGFKDVTKLSAIRTPIVDAIGKGVLLENSYYITSIGELSRSDGNGFYFIFLNLAVTVV